MMFRRFVALLFAVALVALAWEPAKIYLKGERPILAREVESLVVPNNEPESSIGPYGVIPASAFARYPMDSRQSIPSAKTMSAAFAAANPITSPNGIVLARPEEDRRVLGVGSVLRESDFVDMLAYPDELRDQVLFFPTDRSGGALSVFSVETRPSRDHLLVNGENTPQERESLSELGDLSLLLGAWALQHPDLSVYYSPDTSLGTDLDVPLSEGLPDGGPVLDSLQVESPGFHSRVFETLSTEIRPALYARLRALAPNLFTEPGVDTGLFIRTDGGLQPTARGVAYSLAAKAARPGSIPLEAASPGLATLAFLQPDGDIAILAYGEEDKPLEVDIPFENSVARYSVPLAPGEVNLIVLPPRPA